MPPDLAAALAASPQASRNFAGLGKTRQYALILGLVTARTADGRARLLGRALAGLVAGSEAGAGRG